MEKVDHRHRFDKLGMGVCKDWTGNWVIYEFKYCEVCKKIKYKSQITIGTVEDYKNRTLLIMDCEKYIRDCDLFQIHFEKDEYKKYPIAKIDFKIDNKNIDNYIDANKNNKNQY